MQFLEDWPGDIFIQAPRALDIKASVPHGGAPHRKKVHQRLKADQSVAVTGTSLFSISLCYFCLMFVVHGW